jgi:hypothetical protein
MPFGSFENESSGHIFLVRNKKTRGKMLRKMRSIAQHFGQGEQRPTGKWIYTNRKGKVALLLTFPFPQMKLAKGFEPPTC